MKSNKNRSGSKFAMVNKTIRFSPLDLEALSVDAVLAGVPLSELIRSRIMGRRIMPLADRQLVGELGTLVSELRALARADKIDLGKVEELADAARELIDRLAERTPADAPELAGDPLDWSEEVYP